MCARHARSVSSLAAASHLTSRDHLLLQWLAEHYVLTTEQIAAALFPSYHRANRRLSQLTEREVLVRWAQPLIGGGRSTFRYTLGEVGLQLYPAVYHHPDDADARAPYSPQQRWMRIMSSSRAQSGHLTATNQFFIDLHARARAEPDFAVLRWWSEQHATRAFAGLTGPLIRPDAHGVWAYRGREVGFFLEHDNGTEPLHRVLSKLDGYGWLPADGPRYPVLLHLPTAARERNLLSVLEDIAVPIPVATAVHGQHPAEAIWSMPGSRHRLHLHELPSDHGPSIAANRTRFGSHPHDRRASAGSTGNDP